MALTIRTNDPFAAMRKNAIPGATYVYVKPKTEKKTDITGTTYISRGAEMPETSGKTKSSVSYVKKTKGTSTSSASNIPTQKEAEAMVLDSALSPKREQKQARYESQRIKPPDTRGGTISQQGRPPIQEAPRYDTIRKSDVSPQARQERYQGYAQLEAREEERRSPETTGGFFFDQPKSRGYYATTYGPAGGFMQFSRESAVSAQRSINPLEWKAGEGFGPVDISNKGFESFGSAVSSDTFKFGGQAAGMGFGLIALGKVPGVGRMFGKSGKSYEVKYWKGGGKFETSTYGTLSGYGSDTFMLGKPAKVTGGLRVMDTKSLKSLVREGDYFDFAYGKGQTFGKRGNLFQFVETRKELAKPVMPEFVDVLNVKMESRSAGVFEGMRIKQSRTLGVSYPVKFEQDSFKVTRYKPKPTGRNVIEELGMSYTKEAKPDFYEDVMKFGRPERDLGRQFDFGAPGTTRTKAATVPRTITRTEVPFSFKEIEQSDMFFPVYAGGQKGPDMGFSLGDMKILSTPSKYESRAGLKLDFGTRQDTRIAPSFRLSGRRQEPKTRDLLGIMPAFDMGSMLDTRAKQREQPRQKQFNAFRLDQFQKSRQKAGFRPPRTPRLGFGFGPAKRGVNAFNPRGFRTPKFSFGGKGHGRIFEKAFFSDLLSVNASMAMFGKATHPRLTKENWKQAESSMFLDVPTVELGKKRKRRRFI